ncbi:MULTISPECIES: isoprenoid biosynthesis glyoxalase ElbB [unclassified Aureispira]|uniref:isoprenoid biosynthesis glyoxalase ElbB n=1 Tax=unclassified Aureispira TaxID=2649989 RepID=UPI0006960221|nr:MULTISPECIES: isoprenoid biosynthesis glyoxalase ElbB [unclassified Aureispira]WMX13943.1 isoprenoid biosynthesis glyoxalase ElbB [Aureispira sp. CCB-E]
MKIGVLLAGSGVYDGSEIQEAVFTLLAIDECGAEAVCIAPNEEQHHVVNHLTGEELPEKRNVLIESARIARGAVSDLANATIDDFDALVIPGGFGAAKNLNQWAIAGPEGAIHADVKRLILNMVKAGKPVAGLCMGPTVIAKALQGEDINASLTVGTTEASSPYDIEGISNGLNEIGALATMATVEEVIVDHTNKIVTAPCYMMDASVREVRENIAMAIVELIHLVQGEQQETT